MDAEMTPPTVHTILEGEREKRIRWLVKRCNQL